MSGCQFAIPARELKRYPPVGYSSAHTPLLSQLHERLSEYEDAVQHAYNVHSKYGDVRTNHVEPPSGEMMARIKRTQSAFDSVLSHVDAVDALLEDDYVLLNRDACSTTNVLYHAPPSVEEEEYKERLINTCSPILCNAVQLDISFRPYPSAELLVRSPILAHSDELRLLASPS